MSSPGPSHAAPERHRRWSAYGKPQRSSLRSSTISPSTCLRTPSTNSKRTPLQAGAKRLGGGNRAGMRAGDFDGGRSRNGAPVRRWLRAHPLSWRHKRTVRSLNCGGSSEQTKPAKGPDLPRGRTLRRRVDDISGLRFQRELGTFSRRHFDAQNESGHPRWVPHAAPGDDIRGPQPTEITMHSPLRGLCVGELDCVGGRAAGASLELSLQQRRSESR